MLATFLFAPAVLLVSPVHSHALQAEAITEALAFLNAVGAGPPAGWTVGVGNLPEGIMGSADARDMTVDVDFAQIERNVLEAGGTLDGSASELGGVVAVVLYHEFRHADGSFPGRGPGVSEALANCHEMNLQVHTATKNCELAAWLAENGFDPQNVCALHSATENCWNTGCGIQGANGVADDWEDLGCEQPDGSTDLPSYPQCSACGGV